VDLSQIIILLALHDRRLEKMLLKNPGYETKLSHPVPFLFDNENVEEAQHCELLDFYFVNIAVSAVCGHGN
jgi:hypothetical protein